MQVVNQNLSEKLAAKAEYDRVIGEAEGAYMKILESSQVLWALELLFRRPLRLNDTGCP